MTLSFNILGFEIATVKLDLPEDTADTVSVVDKGAKWVSREFFRRMIR